ncbi:MAG: hypothetical protein M1833_000189 [Piccolia ochrophora]|nr:MAG: hypothetical protein M1833_000189 [Piccolia ochrophora]
MDVNVPAAPFTFMPRLSLAERWEELKPTISRLYVDENRKLSEVIDIINSQYGFDAAENQYKYQINRKWKLKKSIPTEKKAQMLQIVDKRAASGKATTLSYKGKEVDRSKLRRLAKNQTRTSLVMVKAQFAGRPSPTVHFGSRIFMDWNMPYVALRLSHARATDHFSPAGTTTYSSPASDVFVTTPMAHNAISPAAESPSGLSQALRTRHTVERTRLFVEGKHVDLIRSMNKQERVAMSTWLYQFWLFSFKTAKHWGKGPQKWTADLLDLDRHLEKLSISSPNTPGQTFASPSRYASVQAQSSGVHMSDYAEIPTALCQWGIHLHDLKYERIWSPPLGEDMARDKWADWPESWRKRSYPERLWDGLKSNDFSNIDTDGLPVTLPKVLRHTSKRADDLLEDALGFSIMSRNVELLFDIVEKVYEADVDVDGLYPFHLATTYLSGSDPCCNVLHSLVYDPSVFSLRKLYTNDIGHTVLDNLMIAILKAHTICTPGDIDDNLKRERRFAGEEVNICGRWDADSDCIRALLARGECRIPSGWKHKFCHTAAQAICHCIGILFSPGWKPEINTPSGLFVKRCLRADCGCKFQLFPLHTLVMVAFKLAQRGCEGEDLFGMIVCLLCLLGKGANPLLTSSLSSQTLFETERRSESCDHEDLDPFQLAERVPKDFLTSWSEDTRVGWQVFCLVLKLSREVWAPGSRRHYDPQTLVVRNIFGEYIPYDGGDMVIDSDDNATSFDNAMVIDKGGMGGHGDDFQDCDVCGEKNYFRGNSDLRDLWAAAQTELLTYRKLQEDDTWTSPKFDLAELLRNYQVGLGIGIGLVDRGMLKDYCECGRFRDAKNKDCACVNEACAFYFSNLEEWDRTTYLECELDNAWKEEPKSDYDEVYDSESDESHESETDEGSSEDSLL